MLMQGTVGPEMLLLQWTTPSSLQGRASFVAFYRRSPSSIPGGAAALLAAISSFMPVTLSPGMSQESLAASILDLTQPWTRFDTIVRDGTSLSIPMEVWLNVTPLLVDCCN
jgi:hypothetical protein